MPAHVHQAFTAPSFSLSDQQDFTKVTCATPTIAIPHWMTMPLTAQARDHLLLLAPLLLNKSPFWQMLLLLTSHWQGNGPISPTSWDPQPSASFKGSWGNHKHINHFFFFQTLPSWHTLVTEQSRYPTKLHGSKTAYKSITLSLKDHHVVPHGFQIHPGRCSHEDIHTHTQKKKSPIPAGTFCGFG